MWGTVLEGEAHQLEGYAQEVDPRNFYSWLMAYV